MTPVQIMVVLLLLWNTIVFFMYGIDKLKAKRRQWRISEKVLLLSAVMMGGLGALIGMKVFHHKTKHPKFNIGVPLALIFNIAVIVALWIGVFSKA